jgi:hypothetical protein
MRRENVPSPEQGIKSLRPGPQQRGVQKVPIIHGHSPTSRSITDAERPAGCALRASHATEVTRTRPNSIDNATLSKMNAGAGNGCK